MELFFYNTGANPEWCHPIHVHGYSVRVVARGRLEPQYYSPPMLEQMDREGMFPRITPAETTAVKDTICVGGSTYLILEFVADNIGWWFVHCHLDYDNMVNISAFNILKFRRVSMDNGGRSGNGGHHFFHNVRTSYIYLWNVIAPGNYVVDGCFILFIYSFAC